MNELEELKGLWRKADDEFKLPESFQVQVGPTIQKRKIRVAKKRELLFCLSCATIAILIATVSIQAYSQQWKRATSSWPGVTQHILFRGAP